MAVKFVTEVTPSSAILVLITTTPTSSLNVKILLIPNTYGLPRSFLSQASWPLARSCHEEQRESDVSGRGILRPPMPCYFDIHQTAQREVGRPWSTWSAVRGPTDVTGTLT